MQTKTGIINQALIFMGQDTIIDPAGESKNAKLCAAVYDQALAEALSCHPWSFAQRAAVLQLLEETSRDARFDYVYQLPVDFGRIIEVIVTGGLDVGERLHLPTFTEMNNTLPVAEYSVQGDKLCSNETGLQILYVRKDVQPSEMPPQFINFFACLIASKLVKKITGSDAAMKEIFQMLPQYKLEAIHTDGEQTDTMPVNRPALFIKARLY